MIKRTIAALLCLVFLLSWAPMARAEEAPAEAIDISEDTFFSGSGYDDFDFLTDKNTDKYHTSSIGCTMTLMNDVGIGSVYLIFDEEYGQYTIENVGTGEVVTAGTHGFLHEYVDLYQAFGQAPTVISIHFELRKARLSEIYLFSAGEVPDFVQKWQPPLDDQTDLLLLSTHGDDDQLFFAGLLPLYAGQKKVGVQVAYLTDHRNLTNARTHEILNGLWAVGCAAYPIMPDFPDFRIDSLRGTYEEFENQGVTKDELRSYVVELLRRFKPKVVVGHDIDGEYGHGMHMVYTDCLIKALELSNDSTAFPETAEKYGLWEVPKTYLHLYDENPIVIDYDQPLSEFDGMTAFQVSQKLGYPCHKSQQYTWFTDWINGDNNQITKASQIKKHNPSYFGLYHSNVGQDVGKDDFLENIVTYGEEARIEAERLEQERLEQEQQLLAQMEAERQELERLEQERAEQKRLEQERLEQEQKELERIQQKQQLRKQRAMAIVSWSILIILVLALIAMILMIRKQKGYSDFEYKE